LVLTAAVASSVAYGILGDWVKSALIATIVLAPAVLALSGLWFLLIASLGLSVYGWELAGTSLINCEVNSHSAPDSPDISGGQDDVRIVTLRQGDSGRSALRHGIYDHPKCVTAISRWLLSELAKRRGHGKPQE